MCTSLRSRHPQNSRSSRSVFLLASSVSFSLPRRYSPLALSPLPHPATSAVRDTPSRMSEGDEMRRLIGFHGNQPALHWHLASLPVEPPPSSSIAPRCTSLVLRTDAVRHADVTPTRNRSGESGSSEFHGTAPSPEGERRRLFSSVLQQLFPSRRKERLRRWSGIG